MKKYETENRERCFLFSFEEYRKMKMLLTAAGVVFCAGIGVFAYSAYSVTSLRTENDLYRKQLKMADEKVEKLIEKVDSVEKIANELAGITGMTSETTVQKTAAGSAVGGAHTVPDAADPNGAYRAAKTPSELLYRMTALDKEIDSKLKMLVKLRSSTQLGSFGSRSVLKGISKALPSVWPVVGEISSGSGWRTSSGIESTYHEGIDIIADYNTPIHAAADGIVTRAGWSDGGYGYLVEIRHADGFSTRYGHNNALLVYEGQEVHQGDTIALSGSTGNSTGAHCHYEVRINGRAVNPMMFLPQD